MSLHQKKWKQKEKEEILLYVEEHGVSKTSREFNISTATIYNWRNKYNALGSEGLENGAKTALERELAQLKRENSELKKMVAEKELAQSARQVISIKMQSLFQSRFSSKISPICFPENL